MTLRMQCWLFAIGAAFFAVGTAPGFALVASATATNVLCFIGSWFFTSAAYIQMQLSTERVDRWASETQFVGTVLFNISTGAAVWAHRVPTERRLVWTPDAFGSVLFLVSSVLAILAVIRLASRSSTDWQGAWINMAGSLAFGASAVGAFVFKNGVTADEFVANTGTFIGALCFMVAALLVLPRHSGAQG
ncbi:MAG TPA: hypothetical protein VFW21_14295 [Mycobacterium sp.]|nr:hypothetical protein [Mycobacterium sp.]